MPERMSTWSGGRLHVVPIAPGHVIAAKNDQVGTLGHQHRHRRRDQFMRDRLAAMDVREQANAQSAERLRQSGDREGRARQLQLMAFV